MTSHQKGRVRTSMVLFAAIAMALSLSVVVVAVVLTQRRLPSGSALSTAGGAVRGAATSTFQETFETTTFRDDAATTAAWDVGNGALTLGDGAGGLYHADSTTAGAEVVQPSGLAALNYSLRALKLDAQGQPHLIWASITGDAQYTQWNGTDWVRADGVTPGVESIPAVTTNTVLLPALELDSQDRPHVVWSEAGTVPANSVVYTRWNGSAWVKADGSAGADVLETTSDKQTRPLLALTSGDRPGIVYTVGFNGGTEMDLHVTVWNGSAWVAPAGTTGAANVSDDAIGPSSNNSYGGDIAFDLQNRPVLAWRECAATCATTRSYVSRWNGSGWSKADGSSGADDIGPATTGSSIENHSLVLTRDDRPTVSWDGELSQTQYSEWNGSAWVRADRVTPGYDILDDNGGTSLFSSHVLSGADRPAVAWAVLIGTTRYVLYAEWDPVDVRWEGADGAVAPQTITTLGPFLTASPSVDLDVRGAPSFGWLQFASFVVREIRFGRWVDPCAASGVAQSASIDATDEPITSATLSVDETLFGGTTSYELSNDGGVTFVPVTPNVPYTFATVGSDLRWRAILTSAGGALDACPIVRSIAITYSTTPTVRITGGTPVELAINVSRVRYPSVDSASVGVVARDDVLVDAFTVSPLVNLRQGTLLLTPSTLLHQDVLAELQRVLPAGATVYLTGGPAALAPSIETGLQAAGFTTVRLGDANRLGTAARIADEIVARNPASTTSAFLAESALFIDALSAGGVAGVTDANGNVAPILLNRRSDPTLDPFTQSFLEAHPQLTSLELIGGQAALHADLESALELRFPSLATVRTAGANRFATNVALMEAHIPNPTAVVIASGQQESVPGSGEPSPGFVSLSASATYTAALLGGPFAAERRAALILTNTATLPAEARAYLQGNAPTITHAFIIGSESDVSVSVEQEVSTLI